MNEEFEELAIRIVSGRVVEVPKFLSDWLSKTKKLFIDGGFCDGAEGHSFETRHPGDGRTLSKVSLAEKTDVDRAVLGAKRAFDEGDWTRRTLEERALLLRRVADKIHEHRAPLAVLESLDTGKPLRETFDSDIVRAAGNFQFFSELAKDEETLTYENPGETHVVRREPLGVVVLITPWNFPLHLATWKLAPALLMGNSCILKPSELTPLTASYLSELLEDVGLPKGVFQLLHGFGEASTGAFLTSHREVNAISFTGETNTGRAIMRSASVGPTRISFEMGGKGASIVFSDANLDLAIGECLRAAFRNQGEICLACPRIFVESSKYDEFVEKFVARVKALRVGNPLSYEIDMGALISEEHLKKVTSYLKDLPKKARVLCGGKSPNGVSKGYFLEPTVIEGVSPEDRISQEEVFGPVACIYPFTSEEELIKTVNGTPYGLANCIWTQDLEKAEAISRKIRSGLVWVNCWYVRDLRVPFGGQKRSGIGREGGQYSLEFFSDWKSVCVKRN